MGIPRNSTIANQHRQVIARTRPPCSLCGEPIDYSIRYPDAMSFTVDHIVPLSRGGPDTIENKAAAHRTCNRMKSDKLLEELGPRVYVTERNW